MPVLEKSMVFTYDTLNIFTDASVSGTYSAPGFIAYLCDKEIGREVKCLINSTNNEGEVYAIKMALLFAAYAKNSSNIKQINIYSDSLITVRGLTEWMKNWINTIKNGKMCSSTGKPVMNQAIFLDCVKIILYYNLSIKFYHVAGHKDCRQSDHIMEFMEDFINTNKNIHISASFAMFLMRCNEDVDNITRKYLNKENKDGFDCKVDSLFTSLYSKSIDFYKYFKLIGEDE